MAVHDLAVAACEHRNFETKLTDAAAHAIDDSVVLPGIAGVKDQTVDGPSLDFEGRRRLNLRFSSHFKNDYREAPEDYKVLCYVELPSTKQVESLLARG